MKQIFVITVLITTLLLAQEKEVENKYLYFSNNNLSSIDISCKKDADCMLTRSLQMGCSQFIAVNKKLTQKEIEAFNAQEGIFWITKDLECRYPSLEQSEQFIAKCVDNVCGLSNGKVTYLPPPPSCGMTEELKQIRKGNKNQKCTPKLIEQHIKEEMKRYGIERKLTSPPPCIHKFKRIK